MLWETIQEESSDVIECASLISNNFTINSANRNNLTRNTEICSRSAQRRLNIDPLILQFNDDDDDDDIINDIDRNLSDTATMTIDDISFYDGNSPPNSPRQCTASPISEIGLLSPESSPQRFTVVKNTVTMIEKHNSIDDDIQSNSVDSGYGASTFKFVEPNIPKQTIITSPINNKTDDKLNIIKNKIKDMTPIKNYRIFHSLSSESMESMDDDYMDLIDMDSLDDNINYPSDLNTLISGHIKTIKTTPEIKRTTVRRCLSLTDSKQLARSNLFEPKTPDILYKKNNDNNKINNYSPKSIERCFKRPEPPSASPKQYKRLKSDLLDNKENENNNNNNYKIVRPILKKSISMNDAHIMTALARSSSEPDLIGDFSKPFSLPLTEGRHRDLKSISCNTMAKLLNGDFSDEIATYKIIDCRYPYEYDGGHITGALNLYTHQQILEELVNCKTENVIVQNETPKRHILVFHCEFSSERGPKLSRFLRNNDRLRNSNTYPALQYPEIYLLHGGYKEFFEKYSNLCEPVAYRPMLDPLFCDAYKTFRAKSRSWNGDLKATTTSNRLMKSRSRLVL